MANWRKWTLLLLRLAFGVLLVVASMDKMVHPKAFSEIVEHYRLFGEALSVLVAVWLPYLEFVVGLLLLTGLWLDAASILNGLLMTGFFVVVLQAFIRHLDIACGCFSIGEEGNIHWMKLVENVFFMSASFFLVRFSFIDKWAKENKTQVAQGPESE